MSLYLRNIDKTRATAEYTPVFEHFYYTVRLQLSLIILILLTLIVPKLIYGKLFSGIQKYNIEPENIYNWDEKGFLLGLSNILKRIMTKKEYKSARVRAAKQNGSRELISLSATICGDGIALPPALIYQGSSGDLIDS
jgi:hypothetical protein